MICAKELEFCADGERLVEAHGVCRLAEVHDSAVLVCPTRTAGALGADEPVVDAENESSEFGFVEKVAILFLEAVFITVVTDDNFAVLYPESVCVVFA